IRPAHRRRRASRSCRLSRGSRAAYRKSAPGHIGRQYQRIGARNRTLALQEIAGAHGVARAYLIAAVELRSRRDAAPIGSLGDAVEQQIAERVRCEIEAAVALEGGQLEIHRAQLLLQRDDAVMGDLALVLVELRRVEIADAVDGEPEPRHEAGRVRDLELAARGPEN